MDIALAPKLAAAAFLGATVATALARRAAPRTDGVMLKLEWIATGEKKRSESVVLRTLLDRPTVLRQPSRTIEVQPCLGENGDYTVGLKLARSEVGAPSFLDTQVKTHDGETVVVMGTTSKEGRKSAERLLFLTATGL